MIKYYGLSALSIIHPEVMDKFNYYLSLSLMACTDKIRLGLPESQELEGCDRLYARLVIIRGFDEPNAFIQAVERQLESLNISAKIND
ncbi:type I-MYXAN CRISPR-associated protein Cas6/Cmx6 [Geminocystis sp. CENA526]|uniref:type I-MYXAN CRISPR-associated protein Cas6/Cmx6 n=1 Tax=Geminocystis sp. CENA526 TaxID=1355871 RepID=UPI003D6FA5F2